jgi:hypothetical protein
MLSGKLLACVGVIVLGPLSVGVVLGYSSPAAEALLAEGLLTHEQLYVFESLSRASPRRARPAALPLIRYERSAGSHSRRAFRRIAERQVWALLSAAGCLRSVHRWLVSTCQCSQ